MAEFMIRGYNVAIPEIDVGDDIFVVKDADGDLNRIQVKTAIGKRQSMSGCYGAQFNIAYAHLEKARKPDITYVFVVRIEERWQEFVIIRRQDLYDIRENNRIGSVRTDSKSGQPYLRLTFAFKPHDVTCSKQSLQQYRNCWALWPVIDHRANVSA
ncbi:MAG TPA: hypothetical protein PKA58_02270 [Polyangium sp.]|nr:hypothetical protein [Polyangium sp.]